jgi:hypothetical protein
VSAARVRALFMMSGPASALLLVALAFGAATASCGGPSTPPASAPQNLAVGRDARTDGPTKDRAGITVVSPGAEPRALRRYTFAAGRTSRRVVTMRNTVKARVDGGPEQRQDQPSVVVTWDITCAEARGEGCSFEDVLVAVELGEDADADLRVRAAKELAALPGTKLRFPVSAAGEMGDAEVLPGPQVQSRDEIAGVIQQLSELLEFLVVPLPVAPIGIGARWDYDKTQMEMGSEVKSHRSFRLADQRADGTLVVEETGNDVIEKHPVKDTRLPAGTTLEAKIATRATIVTGLDGLAREVDADMTQQERIELPRDGHLRTVEKESNVRHRVSEPKK